MPKSKVARLLKIFANRESGVTFIETVIALAILSAVGVTFLSGLATTSKAVIVSQERVVAENLAKSQLESIKAQDYISVASYDPYDPAKRYLLIDLSDGLVQGGYSIEIDVPEAVVSPGGNGFELQRIAVVVKRSGEELLTISDYKVGKLT